MTNKTWYKYSERKPTFDDGKREFVLRNDSVSPSVVHWSATYNTGHWRRLDADDFPPKERKLHPAWQPIQADRVYKVVWLLLANSDMRSFTYEIGGEAALGLVYTHWQPAKLPPIWEDEQ